MKENLADVARETVEDLGRNMPISDYVTFLEEVIDQLGTSLEAARDDERHAVAPI